MSEVLNRPSTFFFLFFSLVAKPNYLFAVSLLCFRGLSVSENGATKKKNNQLCLKLGGQIVRGCVQVIKFLATIPTKKEGGYFCCAVSLHAWQFLSLCEAEGFERCADPLDPLFLVKSESKMPLGHFFHPGGKTLLMLVCIFELLHLYCCEACAVCTHSIVLQHSLFRKLLQGL